MSDFNPALATSLAQTLEEADRSATAGEWSVWTSNSVRRITADRQQDGGVLSAITHRDGMPDLSGNNRDNDLAAICALRNHARQAAEQLRAACAEVANLREFIAASEEVAKAMAAESLLAENERLRAAFKQMIAKAQSGGHTIRSAFCSWCNEHWPHLEGETAEVTRQYAREHAFKCVSHPLRIERDSLAAKISTLEQECGRMRGERDEARAHVDTMLALNDEQQKEIERLRLRADELEASMDAAQAAIVSECVEHVELNGHIDLVKECCDYLDHEAMDGGDPSGKLRDFVTSLSVVVQQFDKQRRRANWHEAGYKAGKQKVVDYQVDKALAAARDELADMCDDYERTLSKLGHYDGCDTDISGTDRIAALRKVGSK